jgi:hypothetical protein
LSNLKQKTLTKPKQFFEFGNWVDETGRDTKDNPIWKQGGKATIDLQKLMKTRMLIEASSGGGKSWLMRKLMEDFFGYVPQFVIDPEGEFSSLREKFGFILVTAERDDDANLMGDVEADPSTAEALAITLLRTHASAVIDISELSIPDRQKFVKNFLEALVNAPRDLRYPAIVWIDEAHDYAGEAGHARKSERETDSLNAVRDLASKGRKRGLCLILATQRLSKLSKDVAFELKNYMVGNTNGDIDQDRAADILGFTGKEGTAQRHELRFLDPGIFWASGPVFSSGLRRVKVGQVVTHHPEAGETGSEYVPPPTPEEVKPQLDAFKEIPEVQRRKLDEVRELRVRDREHLNEIQSLKMRLNNAQAQLERAQVDAPMNPERIKAVQEEYFAKGQRTAIDKFNLAFTKTQNDLKRTRELLGEVLKFTTTQAQITSSIRSKAEAYLAEPVPQFPDPIPLPEVKSSPILPPRYNVAPVRNPTLVPQRTLATSLDSDATPLGKAERAILKFLAMRPGREFNKEQVGGLTNYAPNSGSFKNTLSKLKTSGYITYSDNRIQLIDSRLDEVIGILGSDYMADDRGNLEVWLNKLGLAPRKIYEILLRNPDQVFSREEIGDATGYEATSGSFKNAISKLVTLGLAQKVDSNGLQFNQELREV